MLNIKVFNIIRKMDCLKLTQTSLRIVGTKYIYKNKIVNWDGKRLLCEHGRKGCECKDCGGSQICAHNRIRRKCKDCGGSGICEHNSVRYICRECGGSAICKHDRQKRFCKDCGGSGICNHGRRMNECKDCGGSQICEHNRIRKTCKMCHPSGHLALLLRSRVRRSLKNYSKIRDKKRTLEYVGCTIETLRTHIETQFTEGMNWENQGVWHIDHIRPCASFNLDNEEERHQCFHYTNLQPLWGPDNIIKGDNYDSDEDEREWNGEEWI